MFGYVTPLKEELKMREFDTFKGVYCTLCKTLGKRYPQWTRLGLSYDFTFMALLLMAIDPQPLLPYTGRCMLHPLRKRTVYHSHPALDYAAAMTVLLGWYKYLDDWHDERDVKAVFALLALWGTVKKIKKQYPLQTAHIEAELKRLSNLEKAGCAYVDESADPFAKLMQHLFCDYPQLTEEQRKVFELIGYNLGRWIYIMDALNDLPSDIKKNNYNAIVLQYNFQKGEDIEALKARTMPPLEQGLTYTLDSMARAYNLLKLHHFKGILDNIMYLG
ncbi:MAG: hypothetical protein H7Y41_04890, partial [Hyphomonadaceae bacterium]|nr:hypothetical protein [Clostridia bacterium]